MGLVCVLLALTCFDRLALLESTSYLKGREEAEREGRGEEWGRRGKERSQCNLKTIKGERSSAATH